jgi:hypothetical protein
MATVKKRGAPASASKNGASIAGQILTENEARAERRAVKAERSADHQARMAKKQAKKIAYHKACKAAAIEARNPQPESKVLAAAAFIEAAASAQDVVSAEWSAELGEALGRLVSTGHSLEQIAALPNAPSLYRLLKWLHDSKHPFHTIYREAKQLLIALYEERIMVNAVTPLLGEVRTEKVGGKDGDTTEVRVADNVERARLIDGAYKFALGYLAPRKHGRTPDNGASGPNEQLQGLFDSLKAGPQE